MVKEKEEKEKWVAQDVPTETAPMVVNTEDGKAYPQAAIDALILNKLDQIEEAVRG